MKYDYNIKTCRARDYTLTALSNYAYGLSMKLVEEKYPFLHNVGHDDQDKAIRYVINNCEFEAHTMAVALNESGLSSGWRVVTQLGNTVQLLMTDKLGNSYYMYIQKKDAQVKKTEQLSNSALATRYCEEHGIINYKVEGDVLTYNVSFPAYLNNPHYTVKHEINLKTGKETTTKLKRYNKNGEDNYR
jgi:hypothetical protein